jgi:oligosaccharyltransferase complex subunit alpha (ribophorin I)
VTYVGGEESNHTGQKSENKIIYGIFNNINPYSLGAGNFHYEYQRPILTVTRLQRVLEVSHWAANLAVEDYYALKHDGAQLDEEFSRIKYQMPPHILEQTNVLNKLVFQLPKEASDVYYRDEVGNVSTSAYFNGVLELQPRFPLFGGWKTTWYTGYNAPLKNFVKKYKGEYILKAQFVENVQDNMAVDDVQLKVILPEGAT